MDRIMQSLTEPLRSFVDQEVASGRYPDSTTFVVELIAAERRKRLLEKVETMIQEAHDSGDESPWTKDDWDFIRGEVRKRLRSRPGAGS